MKVITSKPLFKDFNKLVISPPSKNKTNSSWVDLMIYLSYWLVTHLTLTFDGVSVVCVILLVCMGEALSPHGLCYVTGDPINGEVFTDLRDPPPRGTNLTHLGGSGVQQPYKGATTFSSDRYDQILKNGSASHTSQLGHLDPVFSLLCQSQNFLSRFLR